MRRVIRWLGCRFGIRPGRRGLGMLWGFFFFGCRGEEMVAGWESGRRTMRREKNEIC